MAPLFVQFLLASVAIAAGSTQYDFCFWTQFRAAVIRDQVWIDGGELFANNSMQAGRGTIYSLNFSSSFDAETNLTTLFKPEIYEQSTNIAPLYVDGTMFANDYEFYLFG